MSLHPGCKTRLPQKAAPQTVSTSIPLSFCLKPHFPSPLGAVLPGLGSGSYREINKFLSAQSVPLSLAQCVRPRPS